MSANSPMDSLVKLLELRRRRLAPLQAEVDTQRGFCQRYRNAIKGLSRLSHFGKPATTPLQRQNQQQFKATLHRLMGIQRVELQRLEANLAVIEAQFLAAWRNEDALHRLIDERIKLCRQASARQEQRIQDGMAGLSWWRPRPH